jgi:hypothetical protein
MTGGIINGGWEFVWAVYGLSFAIYTIYTVSVILRWKGACQRTEREADRRS